MRKTHGIHNFQKVDISTIINKYISYYTIKKMSHPPFIESIRKKSAQLSHPVLPQYHPDPSTSHNYQNPNNNSPITPKKIVNVDKTNQDSYNGFKGLKSNLGNNSSHDVLPYTSYKFEGYHLNSGAHHQNNKKYGNMKNSLMGIQTNESINPKKGQLDDSGKKPKRMPRASMPNFGPQFQEDIIENNTSTQHQELSPLNQKGDVFSKKKSMQKPTNFHKDFKERVMMRKSSIDLSTQSWRNQNSPLKKQRKKKFTLNDFEKVKELGAGKYGQVFLAREKATSMIFALKIIEKKQLKQQEITEQFIRELKIQLFLNHPNIVKMYGFFDDPYNIYIILEAALSGQLFTYLKKSKTISQQKTANLMRQVCQAVSQLHADQIIHRDIKPENIVMHENVVKLCDFGWSVHRDEKLRSTFCGTPLYVCPEILKGKDYDEKIDIWSLGVMMYEMLIGENPFKITKQEDLIKIVKQKVNIPGYVKISEQAQNFLFCCLQKNPNDRKNIRELLNHSFFKKYPEKNGKMGI